MVLDSFVWLVYCVVYTFFVGDKRARRTERASTEPADGEGAPGAKKRLKHAGE